MAVDLPESQFVGIDLSETAIARATELARHAGVENITFRQVDAAELVGRPGECDYVIAHGVFSWVSREVQEKILEFCERVLPTGIAYISYNTYPGWHVREMLAEMMRFHTSGVEDPEVAVTEGLALCRRSVARSAMTTRTRKRCCRKWSASFAAIRLSPSTTISARK